MMDALRDNSRTLVTKNEQILKIWLNYQNKICSYSIKLLHWKEVRNEGIYFQVYEQSQRLNVLTTN